MSTSPIQEQQSTHSWIAHMKVVPKGWTCTRQDYWCVCLVFLKIKGQSKSFLSAPSTEMTKVYMGGRIWQGHMLKWTWGGQTAYSEKWIRTRAQCLNRAEEMALIKKFIVLFDAGALSLLLLRIEFSYIHVNRFPKWCSGKEFVCNSLWVQSLGWKDQLEKEMATHSSMHAWKIPWAEEPGGLQSIGLQRVGQDWAHTHLHAYARHYKLPNIGHTLPDIGYHVLFNSS